VDRTHDGTCPGSGLLSAAERGVGVGVGVGQRTEKRGVGAGVEVNKTALIEEKGERNDAKTGGTKGKQTEKRPTSSC